MFLTLQNVEMCDVERGEAELHITRQDKHFVMLETLLTNIIIVANLRMSFSCFNKQIKGKYLVKSHRFPRLFQNKVLL